MFIKFSDLDFRLLDAEIALERLTEHLQLIENQIEDLEKKERDKLDREFEEIDKIYKCANFTLELSAEKEIAHKNYEWRIDDLSLFFRGPFLVSLYAVYESVVIEIADLIRDEQSQQIKIYDLKGNFLDRAKKYYKHILQFKLYSNERAWQQIKMLSDLRNALAHANGRVDRLKSNPKRNIERWDQQQNIGISITTFDHVKCEADIVDDLFGAVRDSLEDLIERYKHWDDQQGAHKHLSADRLQC